MSVIKAHQRFYVYRRLFSFNVDMTFMRMFYSCLTLSFI